MTILILVLLLVANAFFVAAEFALVKVPLVRLDALAKTGGGAAKMTLRIANNLETYLATCQLGITMASLGLGWIGEPAVASLLEPVFVSLGMSTESVHLVSFLIGFILFSSLHIVVGEQVPKTYAIRKPDVVSVWVAYPLHFAYLLTFPLTWVLNLASNKTLHMLGVTELSHVDVLSGREIQVLIDASKEHGAIEAGHADMMQNLFAFHDRPVERIMLPRRFIETFDLNSSREQLIQRIAETQHSRIAVIDGSWEKFVGVVLVKELLLLIVQQDTEYPLKEHRSIVREPQLVPEASPVAKLFQAMQAKHNHIAFAVDEYDELTGLVTMEDLVEEIVGDISDESDVLDGFDKISETDGGWLCDGLVLIGDIERTIGFEYDASIEANTITGLFMNELSQLPTLGDKVEVGGISFEIKKMNGRRPSEVFIQQSETKIFDDENQSSEE